MSSREKTDERDIAHALSRVFRSKFPDPSTAPGFRTNAWARGVPRSPEELRPLHPTMLHAFAAAAKSRSKGVTLLAEEEGGPDEHRTYRDLCQASIAMASALDDAGVAKGDRVVIVLPTSFDFVIAFFALEMIGAIAVPAYPAQLLERKERAVERVVHIAAAAGARFVITDGASRPLLGEVGLRVRSIEHVFTVAELHDAPVTQPVKPRAMPEDIAFVQYTSGSTGHPKGVELTHANLVANIHAIGQAARINRSDIVVSWLPLYHDMGLIGTLLFSIYWRIPLVLLSPTAFMMRPARWLRAIERYRGTLASAPNFAYGLCTKRTTDDELKGLDLSSWRFALNGAEPVNMRTVVDFRRKFEPYGLRTDVIAPCYGLAEATLAVTMSRPFSQVHHQVVDRRALASGQSVQGKGRGSVAIIGCGTPLPGHTVLVVDEHGRRLPDREVGHIVVRGPSVMSGYFQDEDATQAVMRDGWLWTGDLGYFFRDELFVTGRAKDLLIVRGKNHYAEDLERVAERVTGVRAGGTVAFGVYDEDQVSDLAVLVCETRVVDAKSRTKLVDEVSARVREFCEVPVDEVVLVPVGTIPKTSSGKRQRALCRERYLKNELAQADVRSKLRGMVAFARSGAGFVAASARRLVSRRSPE